MADARTTVVLEAPGRLAATLAELAAADPARPVAVVRELTKLHEEVWRGTLGEAAAAFAARDVRGEIVLVIGGAPPAAPAGDAAVEAAVRAALDDDPTAGPRQVAELVAASLERAPPARLRGRPAPPGRRGARRRHVGTAAEGAGTLPAVPPYYLTTPIYYVNDAPHVGTAYTTVNADALARWHRLLGDDVWFMTGTDEHGAKIVEAAEANETTPQEWTDRTSARFVEAWERLDISNDDFIRTTEPRHYEVVQQFLQRIYDNGFIELGSYSGLYCVSCEDYYTEDQLVDGKCPVHGRPVVEMKEDNYFFKLSQFEQRLLDYYDSHPDFVRPTSKRNEALGFIRGGLRDVSITRTSFTWGVPVPWDSGHVFYVWYDALINYLTVAGYGGDPATFEARWGAAHHLIGKDILKFHCVWWPAMCMAAGIEPPAEIFVHGYLLMGGQKLGKTMIASGLAGGEGAAPLNITDVSPLALADDFGVDPLRYHLLRDVALGGDGDFSYEGIVARYNADLANNLGNLVSRVTTVVTSKCGGVGPGCNAGQRARAAWRPPCSRRRRRPGPAGRRTTRSKRRGGSSARPTQSSSRPSRGRWIPGRRSTPSSATPSRSCASWPSWSPRPCRRRRSRCGDASALAGTPRRPRVPADAAWGGYTGGVRRGEG